MIRRDILHHDRSMDDAVGLILARERFRRFKAEGWRNGRGADPARWSQKSVAKRLGITGAALCMWESGHCHPATLMAWHDWAGAYKLDLADVIAEVEAARRVR